MKFKTAFGLVLYNVIAKHMPPSNSPFNFGQKKLRAFCGKLILKKCGENVNIEKDAFFTSSVTLGNNSGLGARCWVGGNCTIGDDVMMGHDCMIYLRNHNFEDLTKPMRLQGYQEYKPVTIGDDVWIGGRVTILPGVKIGSHSIIGTCAVVTKDVPEYAIVGGNPARVLKYRKNPN